MSVWQEDVTSSYSVWEEVVKDCFRRITAEHLGHAHVSVLVCLSVYYANAVPTQRQHLDLQILCSFFKGKFYSITHPIDIMQKKVCYVFSFVIIIDILKVQLFVLFKLPFNVWKLSVLPKM